MKHSNSLWRKRPKDYKEFKAEIMEHVLQIAETHFPGLAEGIIFHEVSTPLTVEHFVTA